MRKIFTLPVQLILSCAFVFLFFAAPTCVWAKGRPHSFVMIADVIEERVFFYSVPKLRFLGELPIALGASGFPPHAGTIGLLNGSILMASERTQEIIAVRVIQSGEPVIDARVSATLGDFAPWSAVDRQFRYFVVGSGIDGSNTQVVNLVDLDTFENTQAEIELTGEGELHPYLVGNPLTLVLADGATMRSFAISDLLDGPPYTPTSTVGVGEGGHGHVFSPKTERVALTTSAGLDVVDVVCPEPQHSDPSCILGERITVPWDVDGRSGGQNFRPRLLNDGRTEMGAIGVAPADPLAWPNTDQDIHIVDMETRTAQRFDLGNGVAARFASSNRFAVFSLVHPDGDRLRLLDVRPSSATYLEFVGDAPLTAMTNGPVAGQPLDGRESRFVGAMPDGRFAFVTHGGDGIVSMVNTATLEVTEFAVPTALVGGGYVVGFRRGSKPVDLIGR